MGKTGLIVIEFLPNLSGEDGPEEGHTPTTFQSVTGLDKPERIISGTWTSSTKKTKTRFSYHASYSKKSL